MKHSHLFVNPYHYYETHLATKKEKKAKKINKPLWGEISKIDSIGKGEKRDFYPVRYIKELKIVDGIEKYNVGDEIRVSIFKKGDFVDVSGYSKGKGFAGVVKRWGFKGGRNTHGSMHHRAPGSIGASEDPSRVLKGQRMPGRMGGNRVTVQNLEIIKVDEENNLLWIKGSVPGSKNGLLFIKKSVKK